MIEMDIKFQISSYISLPVKQKQTFQKIRSIILVMG
jgi:hypothetical protein